MTPSTRHQQRIDWPLNNPRGGPHDELALLLELPGTRVTGRAIIARWVAPGAAPEASGWTITPVRTRLGIVHLGIGNTHPPDGLATIGIVELTADDRDALRRETRSAYWTARLDDRGLAITLQLLAQIPNVHDVRSLSAAGLGGMHLAAWHELDPEPAQLRFD